MRMKTLFRALSGILFVQSAALAAERPKELGSVADLVSRGCSVVGAGSLERRKVDVPSESIPGDKVTDWKIDGIVTLQCGQQVAVCNVYLYQFGKSTSGSQCWEVK